MDRGQYKQDRCRRRRGEREGENFERYFLPPRASHRRPHPPATPIGLFLRRSFLLSFAQFRIAREYFEKNFPRRGLAGTPKEIS